MFREGSSHERVERLIREYLVERGPSTKLSILSSIANEGLVTGKSVVEVLDESDKFVKDDSGRYHLTGGD